MVDKIVHSRCKLYTFLIFFIISAPVHAVEVIVLQSVHDHVLYKTLPLRFVLNEHECGIIKNTLQFSVDRGDIALTMWRPLMSVNDTFLTAFKRNMHVIEQSFEGSLSLDFSCYDKKQSINTLASTALTVSCLVVHKDGKVKPFVSVIPCVEQSHIVSQCDSSHLLNPTQLAEIITIPGVPVVDLEKDLEPLNQLERVWLQLQLITINMMQSLWSFKWLLILLVMCMLCFIKRRYWWTRIVMPLTDDARQEMGRAIIFCVLVGAIYATRYVIGMVWVSYALACLCMCGMAYAFATSQNDATLLERIKNLIGFALGMIILPLLLKGYLVHVGLG